MAAGDVVVGAVTRRSRVQLSRVGMFSLGLSPVSLTSSHSTNTQLVGLGQLVIPNVNVDGHLSLCVNHVSGWPPVQV